jgi:hypothetical protein
MPLPPPLPDPTHIETRLLVVAEMLEKAVAEVVNVMAEIRGTIRQPDDPQDPARPEEHQ